MSALRNAAAISEFRQSLGSLRAPAYVCRLNWIMAPKFKDDENLFRRIHPRFKLKVKVRTRSRETRWIYGSAINVIATGMAATWNSTVTHP